MVLNLYGEIYKKGGLMSPPLQEFLGHGICQEELGIVSKCLVWRMAEKRQEAKTWKQNHRNVIIERDIKSLWLSLSALLVHDSISCITARDEEPLPSEAAFCICIAMFFPLLPEISLPLASSQWISSFPWETYGEVQSLFLAHVNAR